MRYARIVQVGLTLTAAALLGAVALAQTDSIYTCTDAQGRRLTSDRPIMACLDREQRELSPSGVLRRIIAPSLSTEERLRAQERARTEAQARARAIEERRLQQALLMRHANEAEHRHERSLALQPVLAMLTAAQQRQQELEQQSYEVAEEWLKLQRADPSQAPSPRLLQRKAGLEQKGAAQATLVQGQQRKVERIEQRFDAELRLLQRLWAERDAAGTAPR